MAALALSEVKATAATQQKKLNAKSTVHLDKTLEVIESLRYQRGPAGRKPWMDEDGNITWSPARIQVATFVWSQVFETTMGLIIVGNLFLIMFEADQDAKCYPSHLNSVAECEDRSDNIQWLVIVNNILLIIYTVECLLRAFVDRGRFFCNTWNNIDLLTVLSGWLSIILANTPAKLGVDLSILKLSRLVRVVRAARVFISAVIVERAAEARANDKERRLKEKEQERASNMVDLAKLCASMDVDGSGSLSLDEMLQGFDESEAFQALMEHMDVKRDDVETIFNVLDEDRPPPFAQKTFYIFFN
ncbi:Sodium channel protein type 11 subunit alpha (NaN) (Sensory neuron sodium channel 2) (Sodium channel protein type XI subunit alpha) (Voltage-gated sodium channel subunit alpha Nav1.9) [Durusdinium trenchii]|uniref:Sodium channel protein type 11 subunit alpha (NaN) (Sensory neuron sodium channel 2) (Sodium channel protein type XI subunit alpha) (Voltage-gated sodium channel subunit alpha Nav1.9) n=1 Tax=Durusdinium trenchii TaxID=1381693 RepID=A0ABP0KW37_9DINO